MTSNTPSTTTILLDKYKSLFERTTEHPICKELCNGTLKDRTLYIYLCQDLGFFETSIRFGCRGKSLAPDSGALITLAKQLGFFANDENTYFHDCIEHLEGCIDDQNEGEWYKTNFLPRITPYIEYLKKGTKSCYPLTYAEYIAYCWTAEEIYLKWAHDLPRGENLHWKYQKWIDLHDGDHFMDWVQFLRDEVNKFEVEEVEASFQRTLRLEYEFFDACYEA